ncbi:hypothetical protein RI129_005796 [Pyrocoelia pectoralis]|uniref:Retinol dehydrogenase 12 n=1 Tax=Pyrocoelia pectoralis TaxID=417401 RepID=A0AAN7ZNS2_9COLE
MGLFNVTCSSDARLDGKTAIITGSNSGIGKCTAQDFYKRGARVIMACRCLSKAEEAKEDIKKSCKSVEKIGEIVTVELDLASIKSIRKCAEKILANEEEINLLINNAGIMFCPEGRTEDGFEMQFGTNHLGHFLFTLLLLPKIVRSAPARIVNISSCGHHLLWGPLAFDDLNWEKRRYNEKQAYYQSKLCNILFTKELTRRLADAQISGVTTYSLHPGMINTDLLRHFDSAFFSGVQWIVRNIGTIFLKTPWQGAQTTIHCAVNEKAGKESGLYYAECAIKNPSAKANRIEDAKLLWETSWEMVGLAHDYNPFDLHDSNPFNSIESSTTTSVAFSFRD